MSVPVAAPVAAPLPIPPAPPCAGPLARCREALATADIELKCHLAAGLAELAWPPSGENQGEGTLAPGEESAPAIKVGSPARPILVAPHKVPQRRVDTPAGHAALLHAIAHIEFNAINLALDCVVRFPGLPAAFYEDWMRVAQEEAEHFQLVRARLRALGQDYGDFEAHDGLWRMAERTAHDPLIRMALVPRVLEARGLDATPLIMDKLRRIGDEASLAVLEVILRDEVGHVAIGDFWFRHFCKERGQEAEPTYRSLMERFDAPFPRPPLHLEARRQAGFSEAELEYFSQPRQSTRAAKLAGSIRPPGSTRGAA